jgi:eukaryotic-like serine/threonine-protein kinase
VKPERWGQVKEVFVSALERDPARRPAFLDEACGDDTELRTEVESLLASDDEAHDFIEQPASSPVRHSRPLTDAAVRSASAQDLESRPRETLQPGRRVGPYEVVALLGRGGMGEVYRGRDTRLGREIAIKVLPAHLADKPSRLRLFEQEARTASALNHPNIVTIHDVGSSEARPYITMELVDGRNLRELLASGPLAARTVVEIAAKLIDGLAKAHEAGIVHRDLKPDNVMVTSEGWVKILDFGLAKLGEPDAPPPEDHGGLDGPTSFRRTAGAFGTPGYMSPEQVRGGPLDFRSDQFSTGAILYELVTGRPAFPGDNALDILAAILHEPPEPIARDPALPDGLLEVIERCLAKDPQDRYASTRDLARDVARELRRLPRDLSGALIIDGPAPPPPTPPPPSPRARRLWPLALIVPLVLAAAWALHSRRAAPTPIDSLAILPFESTARDGTSEYLSDGLTEGLIRSLSERPHLRVIARSTVFRYKGIPADPRETGRTLGVKAVLVGRVESAPDAVSIDAELVDVATGAQIWGGHITRANAELAALEEDVSGAVARALGLPPTPPAPGGRSRPATRDVQAYHAYLRGRYFWNKRTEEGFEKAMASFGEAIARDPQFALAYAGLGDAYELLADYGFLPPEEGAARARVMALKALEIDDRLAEPHACLAGIEFGHDWDWAGAEREYKRALELNPGYATAHQWYAEFLIATGATESALAEIRRAQELDPLSPIIQTSVGWLLHFARRYPEAIDALRQAVELDPNYVWAHVRLGEAYENAGRHAEAVAQTRTTLAVMAHMHVARGAKVIEAHLYAADGKRAKALKVLEEVRDSAERTPMDAYAMSQVYAALGEKGEAMRWLEQAYRDRVNFVAFAGVDPWFDPLRPDPRFQDLLRRVGIPERARGVASPAAAESTAAVK